MAFPPKRIDKKDLLKPIGVVVEESHEQLAKGHMVFESEDVFVRGWQRLRHVQRPNVALRLEPFRVATLQRGQHGRTTTTYKQNGHIAPEWYTTGLIWYFYEKK